VTPSSRFNAVRVGLVALIVVALPGTLLASAAPKSQPGEWTPAWAASPQEPYPAAINIEAGISPGFRCPDRVSNQTIRNVIWPDINGSAVRVRLTNAFGATPLQIGSASVAIQGRAAVAAPGTMRPLTFGGKTSAVIGPGEAMLSDPIDLAVSPQERLLVSVFLPDDAPLTEHAVAQTTSFMANGDAALADSGEAYATNVTCWLFIDRVDVLARKSVRGTVVALGDSLTDGFLSDMNADSRWPNFLARRVNAHADRLSIIDEGIFGDQLLLSTRLGGPSVLDRLDRDALDQPRVRAVILLIGINDIGCSGTTAPSCGGGMPDISAEKLIAGYEEVIRRAHARGIKVFGSPLLPFARAYNDPYMPQIFHWTPAKEQIRQQVNLWIRTSGAFDGVIDFDTAVASPRDPLVMNPLLNGGDQLHCNDRGYEAMADTVPLGLLMSAAK
jgi:lysophospholipase L1-like esterase